MRHGRGVAEIEVAVALRRAVAPDVEDELEAIVMAQPKVQANLEGKTVVKVIHVGGRLVNIVVR